MTARVQLPSEGQVQAALADLTESQDGPPTVVALSRALGLTNSTFWRYFPETARSVAERGRELKRQPKPAPPDGADVSDSDEDVSRLKRRNQALSDHLEVALAQLQRLTLDNRALREALEAANNVTRLTPRDPSR